MENHIFKIKRAFLVPFMVMTVLLLPSLILGCYQGQALEQVILAVSFFFTLIVGVEAVQREISVSSDGMSIKKFFRTKSFTWPEITHLAVVDLRNKVYFLLTTTKGFYFFSNMYENHPLLLRSIMDKLDAEKVEPELSNYLEHPKERRSLVIICWVIVLLISAFIVFKLLSLTTILK